MNNKLKIEHLLPYGKNLNLMWEGVVCNLEGFDFINNKVILERVNCNLEDVKPILRPLSDIVSFLENEHREVITKGEENWIYLLDYHNLKPIDMLNAPFSIFSIFVKNHFDVFGLIEKGLAINYNEIKR